MMLIVEKIAEKILIRPEKLSDLPLFKHCAGGLAQVLEENFINEIAFILQAHHVKCQIKKKR